MKKKLEIGIIGCGAVAQIIHLPILKKMNNVKIKAICDIDKRKLIAIKDKYDIEFAYSDIEKFLQAHEYDAVMILTPTNTHKEIAELVSDYCKIFSSKNQQHLLSKKPKNLKKS